MDSYSSLPEVKDRGRGPRGFQRGIWVSVLSPHIGGCRQAAFHLGGGELDNRNHLTFTWKVRAGSATAMSHCPHCVTGDLCVPIRVISVPTLPSLVMAKHANLVFPWEIPISMYS